MSAYRHRGATQGRVRGLVAQRASQRAAVNRPDLTPYLNSPETVTTPVTVTPTLTDWPVIRSQHPEWWQVHRVLLGPDGSRAYQLIAECQSEDRAFTVVAQQLHQCRVTKWDDRRPAYFSFRPPKGGV